MWCRNQDTLGSERGDCTDSLTGDHVATEGHLDHC